MNDPITYKRNEAFVHWLNENKIDHESIPNPGQHSWQQWREDLKIFAKLAFGNQQ
ncbi:MAG: hypothetical protein MI748_04120 [Opitutales bacterium]|nr:hypothetical protein [Opitutales bacterium]